MIRQHNITYVLMMSVRVADDAELTACLSHKSADDDDDDDDDAGEFTASLPPAPASAADAVVE